MAREAGPKPMVRRERGVVGEVVRGERRAATWREVRGVLGGVVVGEVAAV